MLLSKSSSLFSATAAAMLLAGCASMEVKELCRFEFHQPHMGTVFKLTFYTHDDIAATNAARAVFTRVEELDNMLSDYDPESELMKLCAMPYGQPVPASDELFELLSRSQRLAQRTDGAFDVTVGPLARLWRRARRAESLPPPDQLQHAMESVGWQKVKLDEATKRVTLLAPRMQLDLGGIAKGYAADQALEVLKRHGITRALIAASGDIAVGDAPPGERCWRVSIGTPRPASTSAAHTLLLKHAAVSTSGDAEQFVEIDGIRYSHIVDPRTGIGLTNQLQVTVVGRDAVDTDSFATALSVMDEAAGLQLIESRPGLEVLMWKGHGAAAHAETSHGFGKILLAD